MGKKRLNTEAARAKRIYSDGKTDLRELLGFQKGTLIGVRVEGEYKPTLDGDDDIVPCEENKSAPDVIEIDYSGEGGVARTETDEERNERQKCSDTDMEMAIQQNSFWAMFYAEFYHLVNYMIYNNVNLFPSAYGYTTHKHKSSGIVRILEPENMEDLDTAPLNDRGKFQAMVQLTMRFIEVVEWNTPCLLQPVGLQHRFRPMILIICECIEGVVEALCTKHSFLGECNSTDSSVLMDLKGIPKSVKKALESKGAVNFASYWLRIRCMLVNLRLIFRQALMVTEWFITYQSQARHLPEADYITRNTYNHLRSQNVAYYGYKIRDQEIEECHEAKRNIFMSYIQFDYISFVSQLCGRTDVAHTSYFAPVYTMYKQQSNVTDDLLDAANYLFGESHYNIMSKLQKRMVSEFQIYRDDIPDHMVAHMDNRLIVELGPYTSIFLRLVMNIAGGKSMRTGPYTDDSYLKGGKRKGKEKRVSEDWETGFTKFIKEYQTSSALFNPFNNIPKEGIDDYHVADYNPGSFVEHWGGMLETVLPCRLTYRACPVNMDQLKDIRKAIAKNAEAELLEILEHEEEKKKREQKKKAKKKEKRKKQKAMSTSDEIEFQLKRAEKIVRNLCAIRVQQWIRKVLLVPRKQERYWKKLYNNAKKDAKRVAYKFTDRYKDQERATKYLLPVTKCILSWTNDKFTRFAAARKAKRFCERYYIQEYVIQRMRPLLPRIMRRRNVMMNRSARNVPPPQVLYSVPGDMWYNFESYRWCAVRDMLTAQLELLLHFYPHHDQIIMKHLKRFRGLAHYEFLMMQPWIRRFLCENYHECFHIQLLREAARRSPLLHTNYEGIVKPEFFC